MKNLKDKLSKTVHWQSYAQVAGQFRWIFRLQVIEQVTTQNHRQIFKQVRDNIEDHLDNEKS